MVGKYEPLRSRLEELDRRGDTTVEFSFAEIETIVGPLPPSARQDRPWWANASHSQSLAWRAAGWHVETVYLDRERVRFARGARGGSYADRGREPARPRTRSAPRPAPVKAKPAATEGPPTGLVLLIGCVKQKADGPLPARDLYTSPLFKRRRAYAEASGAPWFIVSSQWGLVAPEQVLAPYDMYLSDQPQSYRRAWGRFVVEQLAVAVPLLEHIAVEIHAGQDYIDAIAEPLSERGARLLTPVDVCSMGEMLRWYDTHAPSSTSTLERQVANALATLVVSDNASTKSELSHAVVELNAPGLYSWWVDTEGAADLSRGLSHSVSAGLIYAGQAGATREASGKVSAATLASRLMSQHLNGSTRGSTFRLTIGSILTAAAELRVTEAEISQWMNDHLRVAAWPTDDPIALLSVERSVLSTLDPPLNLDEVSPTPLRLELSRLRRVFNHSDAR